MRSFNAAILVAIATLALSSRSEASCDLCSIYIAQQQREFHPGTVTIGAFEQFTSFERLQTKDEKTVSDPAHQYLKASSTQLLARYDFDEDFSLQGNLPILARSYRRAVGDGVERGSESGIGDIPISLLFSPYTHRESDSFFRVTFQGGIKMPTGDYDRLKEELGESPSKEQDEHTGEEEHHDASHSVMGLKHAGEDHGPNAVPTGVHGHDLVLGTGSWDILSGMNIFGQYERWLVSGNIQYIYRTEGVYDYRFADLLVWELGFGRYVWLDDKGSVSLRGNLLGEAKGMDQLEGKDVTDTGITTIFAGPEINFTLKNYLFGSLALDLPVLINTTDTMLVTDYRFRMAVTYRF